jgi:hypothetical protein
MTEQTTRTIQITDPNTKAFYAGVAAGSDVVDTLPEGPHNHRLAFYWFQVGLKAERDPNCTTETVDMFLRGASTRSPGVPDDVIEAAEQARDAADGDSNDREIELLQVALEAALGALGRGL